MTETPDNPTMTEALEFADAIDGIDPDSIELDKCEVSFLINVSNVETLGEALDTAALNLGRYGMDPFYMLAKNPDTGEQWVINGGIVQKFEDVFSDDDEPAEEAEQN